MEHLVAVKILHDIKNRMVYNLYTEFLRFLGMYIGEGIADEYTAEEAQEDLKCFQFIIYISEKEFEKYNDVFDGKDMFYVDPKHYADLNFSNSNLHKFTDNIKNVLNGMQNRAIKRGIIFPNEDAVEELLRIFLSNNILKGSYILQYYRLVNSIHEESESIFSDSLSDIEKIDNVFLCNEKVVRYAKLYCKQKINLARFYQKDKVFAFSIKELAEECMRLIDDHPEFSNAWVLLGMIYEKSHDDVKKAIEAYYTAIEEVGDCCYSAHIFYWIGNLYEKFESCHEDAKLAYQRARNHKRKYRNIYKLAKMAEYEKEYETEVSYYEECLHTLDKYKELLLDPLEMEYYYKTGVLACFKCVNFLRKYNVGIKYGLEMEKFYNRIIKNGTYFKMLFDSEEDKYRRISMERISLKKLYECLAIAYREIGQLSESEKYWQESEKF